jgi:hypothetical protein
MKNGRFSKEKGKRGEREFVHFCSQFDWLVDLVKSLNMILRRGAQVKGTPDSPDVEGLPFLHMEVKRRERFDVYDFLQQAESEAGEGEIPIVACRKNRKKWLVVLSADVFFNEFYRIYLENKLKQERSVKDEWVNH